MQDLSPRQSNLLKTIIDDYISSAAPIGSESLVQKHKLKCSPATVRNEMAELIRKGFLQMVHTSSGRIPTSLGIRYYINELMTEEEVPVLQEVSMKQRVWQERFETLYLLRNIALALAESTKYMSVVSLDDGYLISAGNVNILEYPEFFDIEVAKAALNILDNYDLFSRVVSKGAGSPDIKILVGGELELNKLDCCGFVYTNFEQKGKRGIMGIFGPNRMPYAKVIPIIKYMRGLVRDLSRSY